MKPNKPRSRFVSNAATVIVTSLVCVQLHAATLLIPSVPVALGTAISPNVSFVLDNSGSMAWTWLPDAANQFRSTNDYQFSNGAGVVVDAVGNFAAYQTTIGPGPTNNRYGLYSNHCNGAHYNPAATYTRPVNADGTSLPNSTYAAAFVNGFNVGLGTVNLATLSIRNGFAGGHYYQYGGVWPVRNFQYTAAGVVNANPFFNECNSAIGAAPGNAVFALINVNTQPAAVQQNYANWFSYYRTRIMAMKSEAGLAFVGLNPSYRVGFQTINNNATNFLNTRPFNPVNKTAWYNSLYGIVPNGGTPLRTALSRAGEYYLTGVMPGATGSVDPVIQSCQKNYTILSSDGYWNGADPAVGNRDLTVPILPAPAPGLTPPPAATGLTPGANWPFPFREGATAAPNTLADVATFYWATDLRPGMANNVSSNVSDPASWQHMTTYTVGFGITGTLAFPGALPALTSGATRWPTPVADQPSAVDDLWHAGLNGYGGYLSAQSPGELKTGLDAVLANVAAREASASSVGASSTSIQSGTRVYQTRFDSSNWTGQLLSFTLDALGVVSSTSEWNAAVKLSAQTGPSADSRVILTRNGVGVPFQWASLSAPQQNALRTPPSGGALDTTIVGQQRLEYLRGWSANEGVAPGQFRARPVGALWGKLGDIIDSSPSYVGQPQGGYSNALHPGYATFRASNLNRTPVVYVGANDGMLHGFDASVTGTSPGVPTTTSGNEVLAYVPTRLFDKLSKLTGQTYGGSHQYYVNSSPMTGDADLSGNAGTAWRSVLVSGLGQGGQAYFALNITNPANFTEANAGTLALWEFSDRDDPDMGYSFNQPVSNRLNGLSGQIVKMNNDRWAVVVGNGYNNTEADGNASTTGRGVLYILFLSNTFSGTWTLGTDYIKISTLNGTVASPNGLATPMPVDTNGDNRVDVIYAGDLNGNMWKFDVASVTPASWNVANGGSPLFAAQTGQAITAAPQVFPHPDGGRMVLFGTGKFIEVVDSTGPFSTQSLYGVWDNNLTVPLASLVQQTITSTVAGAVTSFRTVSSNAVNYGGGAKGWYLNLTVSAGEAAPFNTALHAGLALYSTAVPSPDPCTQGEGWLMALDPLTGTASSSGSFDANGDGTIDATENLTSFGSSATTAVAGRRHTTGITSTPTILSVPTSASTSSPYQSGVFGGGGGGGGGGGPCGGSTAYGSGVLGLAAFGMISSCANRGRIMWKEVLQ